MSRATSVFRRCLLLAAMASTVRPGAVAAQTGDRGIEFDDFGFEHPLPCSPRALALGSTAANASDATALVANPACLVRIKRISAVASISGAHAARDYAYAGDVRGSDRDEVALQFVGGAYPLPVLRGALVGAVGLQRLFTSSLDLSYQGYNAVDERDDRFALAQSGATYAFHLGIGADVAKALAIGADLMLFEGGLDRLRQYDMRGRVVDPNVHTFVYEEMSADVGGYGARLGLVLTPFPVLQFGLSVTSPLALKLHASTVTEETRQVDNDVGSFTRETTDESTEYQTPYRLDAALALPLSPSLLVTAHLGYADWSQATIGGDRQVTDDLQSVLRAVTDVGAGIEWTLSRWPVRVRAGFVHARFAGAYLEADRLDNDQLEPIAQEDATVRYSLGVACVLRSSIVLDAAIANGQGERTSATIGDSRKVMSASIACGYWF